MTGSAARVVAGRAADPDRLERAWKHWARTACGGPHGCIGATAGLTDDDTFIACMRFATAESAADAPTAFDDVLALLDEPTLEDSTRTEIWNRGGSDAAGFVQIRRGRSNDPGRLRHLYVDEQPVRMGPHRPEVLGGMFVWHGDDAFTLSAYFTSEVDARRGEQLHAFESFYDDIDAVMQDVTYLDLRDPWFVSSS